jgi:hypothetical protein
MPAPRQTYYDVLGVKRDAKLTDITRAYNKIKSDMRKEEAAPDKKRAALVQLAHETLSDPASRDAYDKSLIGPERRRRTASMSAVIVGVAIAVTAGYFVFVPPPLADNKGAPPRTADEIRRAASLAVGSLRRIDMSGKMTPVGIAFATDSGVMVTTCHEVVPGTHLIVHFSPRDIPARVMTESAGLCQLAVDGVGSWPLPPSPTVPKPGDKAYAMKINAVGEVVIIEGSVKRVTEGPAGRVVEGSMPVATAAGGGPLLDAHGGVIGVASLTQPDDRGRFVALPASWGAHQKIDKPEPKKVEPSYQVMPKNTIEDTPLNRHQRSRRGLQAPDGSPIPDDL